MKFRFHVLGIPFTRTNKDYMPCPFTQKARLFCKMMHARGHYIMHYGTEGSDPDCDENIVVLSNEDYDKDYGMNNKSNLLYKNDMDTAAARTFFKNTIAEIKKRIQPYDIILPFYGICMKEVCDAFPNNIVIEPGIGYTGSFAHFRVFESNAMMCMDAGRKGTDIEPSFYDVVIPPFFDVDDFTFNADVRTEDPYFLFIGRVGYHKGVNIARDVCKALGVKLKVAGPLPTDMTEKEILELLGDAEYVGMVQGEERNKLYANAVATLMPTRYYEPFGYVQVESMLCGTPVITTDWGAFPEVNKDDVTGYRCRTLNDFIVAAKKCLDGWIGPYDCYNYAVEHYSFDHIAPLYEKYFEDVLAIYDGRNGWYEIKDL